MSPVCMEPPDIVREMDALAEILAGILLVRRDGTIGLANRAMADMLETAVDDLVGAKMAALFESYDAYRSFDHRQRTEMERHGTMRGEVRLRSASGRRVWCTFAGRRAYRLAPEFAVLWTVTDITVRKDIEEKLRRYAVDLQRTQEEENRVAEELQLAVKQLQRAKVDAERANRRKSDFLVRVSHDVRTPIGGMIGLTDLLAGTDLASVQREYVADIAHTARHLLALVNDILDFSKMEADKLTIEKRPVSLHELVAGVVAGAKPQGRKKGLGCTLQIEPSVPDRVSADAPRLKQVLFNLLDNALKFTDEGGVFLTVRSIAGGGDGGGMLRFEVADTGIGIPPQRQEQIFDSFSQIDPSAGGRAEGTGLGLSISRRLVVLMGGTIGVESKEGAGSRFWFTLPYDDPGDAPAKVDGDSARKAPESGEPLRLLVAEDNVINQKVATRLLEKRGHRVSVADSGVQVLEALAQEPFDLILMDVQMPVLDGVETTKRIRAASGGEFDPTIPIVALTAHALAGDRERLLAAGMDDYVAKPFEAEALHSTIHRVYAEWQRRAGDRADRDEVLATVNFEAARKRLDNDGELVAHLHRMFGEEAPRRVELFHQLVDEGDVESLRRMAHTFKGFAGTIGAERLAQVLASAETAASQPELYELAESVAREVSAVVTELAQHDGGINALGG